MLPKATQLSGELKQNCTMDCEHGFTVFKPFRPFFLWVVAGYNGEIAQSANTLWWLYSLHATKMHDPQHNGGLHTEQDEEIHSLCQEPLERRGDCVFTACKKRCKYRGMTNSETRRSYEKSLGSCCRSAERQQRLKKDKGLGYKHISSFPQVHLLKPASR